jgi:hypothetical protein
MKSMSATEKKEIGVAVGLIAALVSILFGFHSFIYPRTEANASLENLSKRVDSVESSEKETSQDLKQDIRDIKKDVNGIYKILINR